jgi:hypothetical protein
LQRRRSSGRCDYSDIQMLDGIKRRVSLACLTGIAIAAAEVHLSVHRRMTVDLEQPDKPAEIMDLMQDDSSYVQAELPRVNPSYKGRAYR